MASALTSIVWVGLVLIGPPALLFWLIRRRKRREPAQKLQVVVPVAPVEVTAASDAPKAPDVGNVAAATGPAGNPYSFPMGMPLIIYPILAITLSAVHRNVWLTALLELLLVTLAVGFARLAFNSTDFEKTHADDPTMNLTTWRINWLLFFATPPAVIAVFGAAQLLR